MFRYLYKSISSRFIRTKEPLSSVDIAQTPVVRQIPVDTQAVRIAYSFPRDKRDNSVWGALPLFEGDVFHVNDIANVLVQDRVNLRSVAEIRFWHAIDRGFVAAPPNGLLHRSLFLDRFGAMRLQFVDSTPRLLVGPSFVVNPNFSFILGTLKPIVRIRINAAGHVVTRVYRAFIDTIGPRIDLSVRCQAAFIVRLPFAPVYSQAPIPLGRGVDICWGLSLTVASFRDSAGFVVLAGLPVGLSLGAALIRGGMLVPMVHPENEPDFLVERIRVAEQDENAPIPVAKAAIDGDATTTSASTTTTTTNTTAVDSLASASARRSARNSSPNRKKSAADEEASPSS